MAAMATSLGFLGVTPLTPVAAAGLVVMRERYAAAVLADHGTESTGGEPR
jgi:hypothetical protein